MRLTSFQTYDISLPLEELVTMTLPKACQKNSGRASKSSQEEPKLAGEYEASCCLLLLANI
jgi:hypothetical protein